MLFKIQNYKIFVKKCGDVTFVTILSLRLV